MRATKLYEAFCVKCKDTKTMVNPYVRLTDSGREVIKGDCPDCGTGMNRIVKNENNIKDLPKSPYHTISLAHYGTAKGVLPFTSLNWYSILSQDTNATPYVPAKLSWRQRFWHWLHNLSAEHVGGCGYE